jgi:FixJ family two-component response regulator
MIANTAFSTLYRTPPAPTRASLSLVSARAGTPDPRPTVHIVHPDGAVTERLDRLCASAGMATRRFATIDAFIESDRPDTPGCLILHVPAALAVDAERLTRFCTPAARPPMIFIADRIDVRTAVLVMKAGAIDFLEEPLCDPDLLDALETAIDTDRARRHAEAGHADLMVRFTTLTNREREVMALVTQGRLNKQVAGDLGLSEVTVKVHRGSAMRKMRARTLADLVRMADAIAARVDAGLA